MGNDSLIPPSRKSDTVAMFMYSYNIYKDCRNSISIKLPALLKMQKYSTTFEQSYIVFIEARNCNEFKEQQVALKKMSKKALTFKQWCLVLDCSVADSKLERIAMKKVLELAITFEQLQIAHKMTNPAGCVKQYYQFRLRWHSFALLKMTKIAGSFDQWNIIYRLAIADDNQEIQSIALDNMSK